MKICFDYFPVSQMLYRFFFMELLIGYFKKFTLKMGDQMGKSTYTMGVITSVHVHTMGEGVKFLPLWCVRTN